VENLKSRAKLQFVSHILSGPPIDWGQNLCECVPLQQLFAKIYVLGTNGLAFGTRPQTPSDQWRAAVSDSHKGRKDWRSKRTKTNNRTIALGQPARHPHNEGASMRRLMAPRFGKTNRICCHFVWSTHTGKIGENK